MPDFYTFKWLGFSGQGKFNHIRLREPIGYIPPAEAEENYHIQLANSHETIIST